MEALSEEERANWYNTITFGWLDPTIHKGYEARLEPRDALIVPKAYDHRVCFAAFQRAWSKYQNKTGNWRIYYSIYAVCGKEFIQAMMLIVVSVVQELAAIFFVNKLISYLDNDSAKLSTGILWAGALGGSMILNAVIRAHAMYWCKLCGISMRNVIFAAIFDKVLKLGPKSHQEASGGKVVNQMAADAQRFLFVMPAIQNLFLVPIYVAYCLIYLWILMGYAVFAGCIVMALCMWLAAYASGVLKVLQARKSKHADTRMEAMGEAVGGVQVMKLYAWEGAFEEKIKQLRIPESMKLWQFARLRLLTTALSLSTPAATLLAMLACRQLLEPGEALGLSATFTAVALVGTLQSPLSGVSDGLASTAQLMVALIRLENFLLQDDRADNIEPIASSLKTELAGEAPDFNACTGSGGGGERIRLAAHISGTWLFSKSTDNSTPIKPQKNTSNKNHHLSAPLLINESIAINEEVVSEDAIALKEVSVNIPKGKLTIICGATGSGKSSLLLGLLGELEKANSQSKLYLEPMIRSNTMFDTNDKLSTFVYPRVAYVPQDAFIFNGTLKDNITFFTHVEYPLEFQNYNHRNSRRSSSSSPQFHPVSPLSQNKNKLKKGNKKYKQMNSNISKSVHSGAKSLSHQNSNQKELSPYDEVRYREALYAAALGADLVSLPAGDATEVGSKGLNLSGGQKQRISVGRALFSDASLFLMDDPLSAVDSHVAQHLWEHAIKPLVEPPSPLSNSCSVISTSYSKTSGDEAKRAAGSNADVKMSSEAGFNDDEEDESRTVVLATNSLALVASDPSVHQIIVMHNGSIAAVDSYSALNHPETGCAEFKKLLETFSSEDVNDNNKGISKDRQEGKMINAVEEEEDDDDTLDDNDKENDIREFILDASPNDVVDQRVGNYDQVNTQEDDGDDMVVIDGEGKLAMLMPSEVSELRLSSAIANQMLNPQSKSEIGQSAQNVSEATTTSTGQLTVAEERHRGAVKGSSYLSYLQSPGSIVLPLFALFLYPAVEALNCIQSYWLGLYEQHHNEKENNNDLLSGKWTASFFLSSYSLLVLGLFLCLCLRAILVCSFIYRSSTNIHTGAVRSVLRSPLSFFDTTPVGRILNRFANDQDDLDSNLPLTVDGFLIQLFSVISILILATIAVPLFVCIIPFVAVVFCQITQRYRRSSREAQRLLAVSRSPLFSLVEESLVGLITLRAFKVETNSFHTNEDTPLCSDLSSSTSPSSLSSTPSTTKLRLNNLTKDQNEPIINSSIPGNDVLLLRSSNGCDNFLELFDVKVQESTSWAYLKLAMDQWLLERLSLVSAVIVGAMAFFMVLLPQLNELIKRVSGAPKSSTDKLQLDPAVAALALAYSVKLVTTLRFAVRYATDSEAKLNALDRLKEFSELPFEASNFDAGTGLLDEKLTKLSTVSNQSQNKIGQVTMENLSARYRSHLPLVLKEVSFRIESGEHVGIVGRTGSGKSSLGLVLLRLLEPCAGRVLIDNIDTAFLSLHTLRRFISVVPQDAVIFRGTIRSNLDPFSEHSDAALWKAIRSTALSSLISSLDQSVEGGGGNFSGGQRQLLCLARAVLRAPGVLLLDEATASVDTNTDAILQKMVRSMFHGVTVLAIAHRLETILDSDKVLVLEKGKVAEFGSPASLLDLPNGIFRSMHDVSAVVP